MQQSLSSSQGCDGNVQLLPPPELEVVLPELELELLVPVVLDAPALVVWVEPELLLREALEPFDVDVEVEVEVDGEAQTPCTHPRPLAQSLSAEHGWPGPAGVEPEQAQKTSAARISVARRMGAPWAVSG